jgi:hypothetical protein
MVARASDSLELRHVIKKEAPRLLAENPTIKLLIVDSVISLLNGNNHIVDFCWSVDQTYQKNHREMFLLVAGILSPNTSKIKPPTVTNHPIMK